MVLDKLWHLVRDLHVLQACTSYYSVLCCCTNPPEHYDTFHISCGTVSVGCFL